MFYQQGDVIIEQVSEIQGTEDKSHSGKVAEGEATGHHHSFENPQNVRFFRQENTLFLDVILPSILRHQEHKPISVPPGKYKIGIVREYDHFLEESRGVAD